MPTPQAEEAGARERQRATEQIGPDVAQYTDLRDCSEYVLCSRSRVDITFLCIPGSYCQNQKVKVTRSCSTLQPHGLYSPWNSGVGSLSLSPGDLLNPGTKLRSPTLQADS